MSWRILIARMPSEVKRRRISEAVRARLDGSVMTRSDRAAISTAAKKLGTLTFTRRSLLHLGDIGSRPLRCPEQGQQFGVEPPFAGPACHLHGQNRCPQCSCQ